MIMAIALQASAGSESERWWSGLSSKIVAMMVARLISLRYSLKVYRGGRGAPVTFTVWSMLHANVLRGGEKNLFTRAI